MAGMGPYCVESAGNSCAGVEIVVAVEAVVVELLQTG